MSPLCSRAGAAARLAGDRAKSEPDAVIYRGTYPGWPWLAATPSGRLVCAFREGTRHGYCPHGKAMLSESTDGGHTWSTARVIVDEPEIDDRNVAVCALSDKDLLVSYNTHGADDTCRAMTVRSHDGGKTWSEPSKVCDLHARTKAAVLRLSTGDLLLPFYAAPGNGSLAAVSTDDGATWEVLRVPDSPGFLGDEWDAVELDDRRLIGIHRNSDPRANSDPQTRGYFWKSESMDAGRTWSVPVRTNVRDARSTSPAQIFRHAGRVFLLYADRRMVSVSMVTTDDPHFVRWNLEDRLACYQYRPDGTPIADGSYAVSAPISDSHRLIVDYQIDGEHIIAGYVVQLPDRWLTS
jgi:hypothetical protein